MTIQTSIEGVYYDYKTKSFIDGLPTKAKVASTSSEELSAHYDTVVVGAGFAGLTCARDLSRAGQRVLLVEGRDRIGGRTWTSVVNGENYEMGGTWVHWFQPHVWSALKRYGLDKDMIQSTVANGVSEINFRNGSNIETMNDHNYEARMIHASRIFFNVDGQNGKSIFPRPHDPFFAAKEVAKYDHLSIQDRLDEITGLSDSDKNLLAAFMCSTSMADPREIGFISILNWYALAGFDIQLVFDTCLRYRLANGTTSLSTAIFNEYKGHSIFSDATSRISHGQEGAIVELRSGRKVQCNHVVVTVPLNCLNDVVFEPQLDPLKVEASKTRHANRGIKIHAAIEEECLGWQGTALPPAKLSLGVSDVSHGPGDGAGLVFFMYPDALSSPSRSNLPQIEAIINADVRPKTVAPWNFRSALYHDWAEDEFSKGAWCVYKPAFMSKYQQALQRQHGRVYFASADHANGWKGFIDGAIEDGRRVAHELTANGSSLKY